MMSNYKVGDRVRIRDDVFTRFKTEDKKGVITQIRVGDSTGFIYVHVQLDDAINVEGYDNVRVMELICQPDEFDVVKNV